MRTILILIVSMNYLCGQAQLIKLYTTKEDYIEKRYESPGNVTLRKYQKADQKLAQSAAYYFWSKDNSTRYQIGRKTFMVECSDSLYINTYVLKNEKNKRIGRGFSKANEHKGIIYFDTILKDKDLIATQAVSQFWTGIIGSFLITHSVAQKQPIIFYCYNMADDSVNELTQEELFKLLEENEKLLSLYKKEPNPEDRGVIALYAEAFFLQKKPKP